MIARRDAHWEDKFIRSVLKRQPILVFQFADDAFVRLHVADLDREQVRAALFEQAGALTSIDRFLINSLRRFLLFDLGVNLARPDPDTVIDHRRFVREWKQVFQLNRRLEGIAKLLGDTNPDDRADDLTGDSGLLQRQR